jgi:hypothetical protein
MTKLHHDSDVHKGAVESESPRDHTHDPMRNQLPHRSAGSFIKDREDDHDTDFPEPGKTPEHSGQHD